MLMSVNMALAATSAFTLLTLPVACQAVAPACAEKVRLRRSVSVPLKLVDSHAMRHKLNVAIWQKPPLRGALRVRVTA